MMTLYFFKRELDLVFFNTWSAVIGSYPFLHKLLSNSNVFNWYHIQVHNNSVRYLNIRKWFHLQDLRSLIISDHINRFINNSFLLSIRFWSTFVFSHMSCLRILLSGSIIRLIFIFFFRCSATEWLVLSNEESLSSRDSLLSTSTTLGVLFDFFILKTLQFGFDFRQFLTLLFECFSVVLQGSSHRGQFLALVRNELSQYLEFIITWVLWFGFFDSFDWIRQIQDHEELPSQP